ncbi:hypothetical protein [Streptomyces orinoci]|uniref:Uncharacterized protein n=1 Tax=Streptomyces orinoci TaxID=67339 RepID=A0ABV3JT69_STRON|nr:hypothetical protein [Streptomyces orinoci]
MMMPRPIAMPLTMTHAAPVVTVPHSSAMGSVNYVTCDACVQFMRARDACLERGDGSSARELGKALREHNKRRHMVVLEP